MKTILLFLCCLLCVCVANVNASTVYVDAIASTVGGDDMDGMLVSIDFETGVDVTNAVWGTLAADTGGIEVTDPAGDWSFTATGADTYDISSYWRLSSDRAINSFTINALAGNTVFDILETYDGGGNPIINPDTLDSQRGWWDMNAFKTTTSGAATSGSGAIGGIGFDWKFESDVALAITSPAAGLGDVFGFFTLTFDVAQAFDTSAPFKFQLDTDAVVPEPATMFLMGVGLIGLAGIGAKKRRRTKS